MGVRLMLGAMRQNTGRDEFHLVPNILAGRSFPFTAPGGWAN
jgi:hypothetical protein